MAIRMCLNEHYDYDVMQEALTREIRSETFGVPAQYQIVRQAWNGFWGRVFFCVHKSVLSSTLKEEVSLGNAAKRLMSEVVAVKSRQRAPEWASLEVQMMEKILEHAKGNVEKFHCARILASGCSHGLEWPNWIEVSAHPGSLTLSNLKDFGWKPCEEFVYHVFIQLMDALFFLHKKCDPPIVHSNIFAENLMLDTRSEPHYPGFPNIILIDFGESDEAPSSYDYAECKLGRDRCMAYSVVYLLGIKASKGSRSAERNSDGFLEFQKMFPSSMYYRKEECSPSLESVWESFGETAKSARANTSPEQLREMSEIFTNASRENEDLLEMDLKRVLEQNLGQHESTA
ncbi:hypothetical protein K504DRAFT_454587 [Pleomassaria siparia CBS 279.74]|uniref:Protein kinase domain-containing protein n=1 Tax=Pleomassaria siparia CBS 279.74 TaxID=1314801 RepID=A0A6G1KC95_9PLEO|nr:hypothetical protein K504DRAFT_454587 [Pleomassaria siparia CBS 279.74]